MFIYLYPKGHLYILFYTNQLVPVFGGKKPLNINKKGSYGVVSYAVLVLQEGSLFDVPQLFSCTGAPSAR